MTERAVVRDQRFRAESPAAWRVVGLRDKLRHCASQATFGSWARPCPHKVAVIYAPPRVEPLAGLSTAIRESRTMLDLSDDWDDEGSPRILESTWRRATEYLRRHAELLYIRSGTRIPTPRILPGPDGSVDLHWKTDRRELLLNVPAQAAEPATFYGDAFGTNSFKGKLDTEAVDLGLFTWLTAME
jgi:hypothetical protein